MYKSEQFSKSSSLLRKSIFCLLLWVFGTFAFFSPGEVDAQGNLLILPRRVVFEGSKKSQELTLANTGSDSAKYVVSIVQMRMKEDGSFEQITVPDSGQFFADKYFRFFPRTVTLPPNQSQVVKMQLTKTAKLAPGEYRSHIYFRAIRKDVPLGEEAEAQRDSNAVSVRLTPVFGITIPAIIRVGECSVKVNISDVAVEMFNDTVPRLQLNFTRIGNISIYGDLTVNYTSPEGKVTKVAIVKGVAVYTPNVLRKFQCNLDKIAGVDYHKGKIKIVYSSPEDIKATKIAEAELLLR
ncbi:MAG: hypothetical protein ACOYNC_11865 [Bacteroidales bacterium]